MFKILFLTLALTLTGCGKLGYSRLEHGYTEVKVAGGGELTATMNGGVMIYFAREGANEGGRAFGFTSTELAAGKSVTVPNGNYKVYALGSEEGSSLTLEGQAKCGIGNGGSVLALSGGTTTVSLVISAANCAFGSDGLFGDVNFANTAQNNFDTMSFQACSTQSYSTCDTNTGATFSVKMRLLAGEKPGKGIPLIRSEAETLTSGCSSSSTSGVATSNILLFAGGQAISPPMEMLVYANGSCSGSPAAQISFEEGLRDFKTVANGAAIFLDSPVSTNITTLKFKYP